MPQALTRNRMRRLRNMKQAGLSEHKLHPGGGVVLQVFLREERAWNYLCGAETPIKSSFFPKASAKGSSEKKNVNLPSPHYNHHTPITTLPSPHYHHHTTITTLQSPHYHHHSTITSLPLLNSLLFLRLGWVSPRLARCTPLRGSCVSERSRCAFLRI